MWHRHMLVYASLQLYRTGWLGYNMFKPQIHNAPKLMDLNRIYTHLHVIVIQKRMSLQRSDLGNKVHLMF